MRDGPDSHFLGTSLAIFAGLICAIVAGLCLTALARPNDYDARLAKVQGQLELAQRLSAKAPKGRLPEPGAICRRADDVALGAMEAALQAEASRSGLTIENLEAAPFKPTENDRLRSSDVMIEAQGPYENAVMFIASSQDLKPALHIEAVDLRTKVSAVSLRIKGRSYCWAAAGL